LGSGIFVKQYDARVPIVYKFDYFVTDHSPDMRYLVLFVALLWGGCVFAQSPGAHVPATTEKYYVLDTNVYLEFNPFAKVSDSLTKVRHAAEATGEQEQAWSIKLYLYVKEYKQHLASADSTEYRLLRLASEAREKNLKRLEADAHQALGELYRDNKQQQSAAIEQFMLAYAIYKDFNGSEFPPVQDYRYRMGLMYYKYQDYDNAIGYLREALRLKQTAKSNLFIPIANALGLCYRNLKQYDSALFYFQRIVDTAQIQNLPVWIGIAQGNIGITYFDQKKYTEAEPLLKKDIESSLANSSPKNAVNSIAVLATIYIEQNRYDEAEKLVFQALAICHRMGFWSDCTLAEKLYSQLYRIYSNQKNYRLANVYADSAMMAKDTAAARYNSLTLSKAYEKQNYIKKKLEAERLQNQAKVDELKKLDQQQLLYKFIIGFLIVALVVATIVNRYRANLKNMATNMLDAPEIVVQKMSIVIISIATCVAALVWTGLYYYYYGFCLVTFLPFTYFLIVGPALLIYFFTKKQQLLVNVQLCCIFFITLAIESASGGFKGGIVIIWAFLAPVGALMYKGIRPAAIWMGLFILAIIALAVFHDSLSRFYFPIPETAAFMFNCMNLLGPAIVVYFSMQFFVKSVIRDGRLLQENNVVLSNTLGELKIEKQKSDDLLLNILPEEVAEELKAKGLTTARHFDNVTVLFTDFVDFTSAAERMAPQALVDELHACFHAFDEITSKYNIEKIKTIGDAYMAVAGLPAADPDHAENVVRASKEINAFMQQRRAKLGDDSFHVRLGIHSGSVVAGIVGMKKFAYDIWGDAVNTASRMEQNGSPGMINISQTTYDLVKDKFTCTYRGEIHAKGKGMLKMYYVE
jgi:class 3 adenylate cyclase/tetratricopeptide (TPR) repeat protein